MNTFVIKNERIYNVTGRGTILEFPEVKLTKISVKDYELLCRQNPTQYEKTELFEGVIVVKEIE